MHEEYALVYSIELPLQRWLFSVCTGSGHAATLVRCCSWRAVVLGTSVSKSHTQMLLRCFVDRCDLSALVYTSLLACLLLDSVYCRNALCAFETGCNCPESAPAATLADFIEYNNATYEFFITPFAWCDAESACRERGGNLASLLTEAGERL